MPWVGHLKRGQYNIGVQHWVTKNKVGSGSNTVKRIDFGPNSTPKGSS